MIDLGAGTVTIAKAIQGAYPNVQFTCLDMAETIRKKWI